MQNKIDFMQLQHHTRQAYQTVLKSHSLNPTIRYFQVQEKLYYFIALQTKRSVGSH